MPKFLNPTGRSTYGIGICDRCKKRFSLGDLHADPNFPGLRVCMADKDEYDPWRKSARQSENVTLTHPRPDEPLTD